MEEDTREIGSVGDNGDVVAVVASDVVDVAHAVVDVASDVDLL